MIRSWNIQKTVNNFPSRKVLIYMHKIEKKNIVSDYINQRKIYQLDLRNIIRILTKYSSKNVTHMYIMSPPERVV